MVKKVRKVVIPAAGPAESYRSPFGYYPYTAHGAISGGRADLKVFFKPGGAS